MTTDVKFSRWDFLKGLSSTIGAFGAGRVIRLAGSVALTRLLSPELFGIIAIVNSVRTGIDLISDVGVAQSIVQNKKGEDSAFYATGWTLKVIRGVVLWLITAAAAPFVSQLYDSGELSVIIPVAALYFIFDGCTSVSLFIMQKRMKITELNILGFLFELIPAAAMVVLAYFYRSIWSMVLGLLFASAIRMVVSHFLVRGVKMRLTLNKEYTWQIIHFGKWIFLSSAIYFFSSNFDRLYLGKTVPFALLGIYGVARSLSDTISVFVGRLSGLIVFPLIAKAADRPRKELRQKVASTRFQLLLLTAFGLAAFAAVADVPIKLIYDPRYYPAADILPFTTLGAWFTIMCSINEAVLLGFARPQYAAAGNALKLAWLLVGLPLGYVWHGFFAVIIVVAVGDMFRYMPILFGQIRNRFSFGRQDFCLSVLMFGLFAFFVWLRWRLGYGLAFGIPVG